MHASEPGAGDRHDRPDDPARPLALLLSCGSSDEADRIARELVGRRLAACVQISAMHSVYRWQGAVHADPEWRLLVKTTAGCAPAAEAAIRALHGYELPAIVALPFAYVPADVAAWIAESCKS